MMSDSLSQLRVLVVDDEPTIRTAIVATLEAEGATLVAVGSGSAALEACRRSAFDAVILDQFIGGQTGLELLPVLLAEAPWMKVVMVTAYASFDLAVQAMRRGACNFLPKPFTPDQLRVIVGEAARQRRVEQRLADSSNSDGPVDFVSADPAMSAAVDLARQVAATDATVLICGETGTGKGELAKAIHRWSPRAQRPLGVISCPSLSAELLESELFGHRKGAFTNAVRDNPGRVAASDGGTLFLDEIGDLPLALQPKFLRFVQDREYERVGDHLTRRADVRLIAATNVALEEAVKAGRFREDLYYRLKVIQIDLPPLRERPEDAATIARGLLAQFAQAMNRPRLELSEQALAAIRRYGWPGNIRELRNVIERAVILARGSIIGPELLRLDSGAQGRSSIDIGTHASMEAVEEQHLRGVLASTASIEEAAAILGMDTVTLWRRRKKYGIE